MQWPANPVHGMHRADGPATVSGFAVCMRSLGPGDRGRLASWAGHLGLQRQLAPRSQRRMQTAVAAFWDYALAHRPWQNEALALSGQGIGTIVTRENRMAYTCDNTPVLQRAYPAADEFERSTEMRTLRPVRPAPARLARPLLVHTCLTQTGTTYPAVVAGVIRTRCNRASYKESERVTAIQHPRSEVKRGCAHCLDRALTRVINDGER